MMATQEAIRAAWPGRVAAPNVLSPVRGWLQKRSFGNWMMFLFLVLTCAPVVALVVLGNSPTAATFDRVAWIFAAYFAVAWLLFLGLVVRPQHVTKTMLAVVTVVALATQVPLAIALETALHSSTTGLAASILTVGIPEELAKALPLIPVALFYWRRRDLQPRDFLFLGAVSGLAFGASEVVHYFTVNGMAEFYQTVQAAVPSIGQQLSSGQSPAASLFDVLIGPVRYFVLDFVWRFMTDPISHACWAGLTGYFIGLAVTRRHKWFLIGWVGLAMAAVLHGLNDWGRLNGHPLWAVVTLLSGVLFLAFAHAGSHSARSVPAGDRPDESAGRLDGPVVGASSQPALH